MRPVCDLDTHWPDRRENDKFTRTLITVNGQEEFFCRLL